MTIEKILVAIDLKDDTQRYLERLGSLGLKVADTVVLHVIEAEPEFVGYDVGPASVRDHVAAHYRTERERTKDLAERMGIASGTITAMAIQGEVTQSILAEAEKLGADLIVLGRRRESQIDKLIRGDVVKRVMKESSRPVLVIPID